LAAPGVLVLQQITAQIDSLGKLTFNGNGVYQVAGNKYAFQFKNDPDFGLFFNSADNRYEFRNGTAVPVFFINANTGALSIGDNTINQNYLLPSARGTNNQILRTDNNGNLSFSNETAVTLAGTNGITTSGTYPNFTISGNNLWKLNGNSGTNAATNFIGTTDATDFVLRTNNTERMRVLSGGNVGHRHQQSLEQNYMLGMVLMFHLQLAVQLFMGPTTAANLAMDNNEIQARNNGAASTLFLNNGGGNLNVDADHLLLTLQQIM
jgi:hypothetical protein